MIVHGLRVCHGCHAAIQHTSEMFAVLAGAGWALGQLGKRYKAVEQEDSQAENLEKPRATWTTQIVIDAIVTVAYIVGQGLPAAIFAAANLQSVRTDLGSKFWDRMPTCMSLGIVEGIGDFFSVVAISLSAQHSLTIMALAIMNSLYASTSPVILAVAFQEPVGLKHAVSFMLLFVGVYLSSDPSVELRNTSQNTSRQVFPLLAAACILTSLCWGVGGIGYRLANKDPNKDAELIWATTSLAMAHVSMATVPLLLAMVIATIAKDLDFGKIRFAVSRRWGACFLYGGVSGTCMISLYIAMMDPRAVSNRMAGIAQGTYNFCCVILARLVYKELLTMRQILGITALLVAVLSLFA